MSNIRLTYVTQWFAPEPRGAADWIAEALRDLGVDIRIVTGKPNYPEGKVQRGYSALGVQRETIKEMPILRCPLYPSHDQSALRRALNYLSYALSASWFGRSWLANGDVTLVYSSPATAAVPALISQKFGGPPFVLLIQDLWPETVVETGMIRSRPLLALARRILGWLDLVSTSSAARIIVIAPGMKSALVARGVRESKISVMYNWVDEAVLHPRRTGLGLRARLGIPHEDLVFLFGGNHGPAQGLGAWLEAIQSVRDLDNLHFLFVGEGTEKDELIRRAQAMELERVYFLSRLELGDYATLTYEADALMVSLADSPLFDITIPGKTQASLALGRAVVAAVRGDAAQLLKESGAAFLAEPGDPGSIANAIREAHSTDRDGLRVKGESGFEFYATHLSAKRGQEILMRVLESAVSEESC